MNTRIFPLALIVLLSTPALADPSANPTNGSDIDATVLRFSRHPLRLHTVDAKGSVNYFRSGNGEQGQSANLQLRVPMFLDPDHEHKYHETDHHGFVLDPGVKVSVSRVAGDDAGLKRHSVEATLFAPMRWHHVSRDGALGEEPRRNHDHTGNETEAECDYYGNVPQAQGKAHSAREIVLFQPTYVDKRDTSTAFEQRGVRVDTLQLSLHDSRAISGVPVDFCAVLKPAALVLSETEIHGKEASAAGYEGSASLCMGAQLGPIGRLRETVGYSLWASGRNEYRGRDDEGRKQYNDAGMISHRVSNTLALEEIAGTPAYVFWNLEKNMTKAGDGAGSSDVTTHTLGAGAAF